jgi:rod shape-determining protein MreC
VRSSFLWRNRVLLASGTLLILALHLLSSGVRPDARAGKPALLLLDILRPFQASAAEISGGSSGFIHDYFDLVGVQRENAELKQQLAQFDSQQARLRELESENQRLAELLELREVLDVKSQAVDVIGSDANALSRTLIIGEGSHDGLRRDMAVIANEGVVGRVMVVAPDAARVLLIDDHNSALDAFDQRSRARGIVAGVTEDGLIMKYVDRSQDLRPGDRIVTSGMDGIFPRGLLIGEVGRVSQEGPGLFLNVEVVPAVDFSKLEQLMILTQKPPELTLERPN